MAIEVSPEVVALYLIDAGFVLIPVGLLVWWFAVVVVPPERTGLYEVLGDYRGQLGPGLHLVWPLVSTVTVVDCRRQRFEVEAWEYETRGDETVSGGVEAETQVTEPEVAHFEAGDHDGEFWRLLHETLEATFADRWLEDILDDPEAVAAAVRRDLDEEATRFGVDVDDVAFSDLRPGDGSHPPAAGDDDATA